MAVKCPACGGEHLVLIRPMNPGPEGWGRRCKACGHRWDVRDEPEPEPEDPRDYCEHADCSRCDGHDGQCTCPCHAPRPPLNAGGRKVGLPVLPKARREAEEGARR